MMRLKTMFSIMPQRANRFFRLQIALKTEGNVLESMTEEHQFMLREAEEKGMVIMATKGKDIYNYVFQSPNETQAFDFLQKTPFKKHALIRKYTIDQLEIQLKMQSKELAPKYLRE